MLSGDIIFTFNKKNFVSYIIWNFSKLNQLKLKVSHVALYLGDGLIAESTVGKGVRIESIDKYKDPKYIVRVGRCKDYVNAEVLIEYCKSKNRIKYAYFQLLVIILKKIFKFKVGDIQEDAMICSEFIVNAYKAVHIELISNKCAANTSPVDILHSDKINIVR